MDAAEKLKEGLAGVNALLAYEALEPDPERTDWNRHKSLVKELGDGFRDRIMKPLERMKWEADAVELEDIRLAVCNVGAQVAAVIYASGAREEAERMVAALAQVDAEEWEAELNAGKRDCENFVRLVYGRWLVGAGKLDKAREVFGRVIATSREPALVEAARAAQIRAKPLKGAPVLFRINGFGFGMYGARNYQGDSYVSTYCVSALWLPVMPLVAYRVVRAGNKYGFISREPLSKFAIWYRRLVLLAALVLIVGSGTVW